MGNGQVSEEEARPPPRPESSGSQRRAPARQDSDRPLPSAEQPADPDSLALLHSMGGASEAILHQLHHRGAGEANPYVQQFPGGLPQHASSHFAAPPELLMPYHNLGGSLPHPGLGENPPRMQGYGEYPFHNSLPRPESSGARQAREEAGLTDEDEEDDGTGVKRSKSSLMSDEERKKRRQEINRQSARRIRERRTQEMEGLRVQVQELKQQQGTLLRYAAQLAREKNGLVQRTLELTERWNITAAENLELRSRLQDLGQALPPPAQDSKDFN